MMKNKLSMWIMATLFAGTLGLASAQAAPTKQTASKQPVELTGCLQQAPDAREYLLMGDNGKAYELSSADREMYMNDYIGKKVTVAGDWVHPKASVKTVSMNNKETPLAGHLRAMDLTVVSETCKK
jgi:hypothetical protein